VRRGSSSARRGSTGVTQVSRNGLLRHLFINLLLFELERISERQQRNRAMRPRGFGMNRDRDG
jgi:hypothetical protein